MINKIIFSESLGLVSVCVCGLEVSTGKYLEYGFRSVGFSARYELEVAFIEAQAVNVGRVPSVDG